MDILPTSIASLGKKLHLSPLTENSGSGAVYACLGTVSKIGGGGIGLDCQEQDRAMLLARDCTSVHVPDNMQLGQERWGLIG